MQSTRIALLLLLIYNVMAEVNRDFERQHMHEAHQIEINDEVTFFKIHDLNGDGFWDESELRSMYGSERDIDPNAEYVQSIIDKVFEKIDMNRDRFISQDEYITATLPDINKRAEKEQTSDAPAEAAKKGNKKSVITSKGSSNKKRNDNSSNTPKQKAGGFIPQKFRA